MTSTVVIVEKYWPQVIECNMSLFLMLSLFEIFFDFVLKELHHKYHFNEKLVFTPPSVL
jgi:hypothetical protein